MKKLLIASVLAVMPVRAFTQTPGTAVGAALATPTGHEVSVGAGGYNYIEEPDDLRISIHGAKLGGEYTGGFSVNRRRHVFAQANARFTFGNTRYDGWCAPFLLIPEPASPNGYAVDLGDYSPCSEPGARDWYVEARALVGKDFIGQRWAWSPGTGLGVRHLSNGARGIPGFRTQEYLYLPFSITARTRMGSQSTLSFNLEYDVLLRGWQTTRNSELGGGDVPATSTAPAFTIEGLDDLSFDQRGGWALRTSAKYQVNRRWSVEPYYVYWRVDDSSVEVANLTFTVNAVTAQQQFGAYEPRNTTHEPGVKFSFRF